MGDSWDRSAFDKELKSILDAKLPVSASKVNALQSLAISHPQHHNYIVQCVVRFIETSPPDYRLAGLYVVDAISRGVHKLQRKSADGKGKQRATEAEAYLRRFAIVLRDDALQGCFAPCSTKDKEKVKRTLDIWDQSGVYSKDLVDCIRRSFMDATTTTAAASDAAGGRQSVSHDSNSNSLVESDQPSKAPEPVVDAAALLAKLSSLSGGNLANLAAPSSATPPAPAPAPASAPAPAPALASAPSVQPASSNDSGLPPELARLLGGIVSKPALAATPPPAAAAAAPVPSLPTPSNTGIISNVSMPPSAPAPPGDPRLRQSLHQSPPPPQQQQQQQRMALDPPRLGGGSSSDSSNLPAPSASTHPRRSRPPRWDTPHHSAGTGAWHEKEQESQHTRPGHAAAAAAPPPPAPGRRLPGPIADPTLKPGTIRVLTRTLFVGGLPETFTQGDVADIFEKFGRLGSIILTRKTRVKANAFIKFETRAGIEAALRNTGNLTLDGDRAKVNWAYGFGPKKLFDYKTGESIIPLADLSETEKTSLMTAPVGGFQGQDVCDRMIIEEPEVAYRPEWKKEDLGKPAGAAAGWTRPDDHDEQQHHRNKRRRFNGPMVGAGDGPYMVPPSSAAAPPPPLPPGMMMPPGMMPPHPGNTPPMLIPMMPSSNMSQLYAAATRASQQQPHHQHPTPHSSAEAPSSFQRHPSQHVPYPDPY